MRVTVDPDPSLPSSFGLVVGRQPFVGPIVASHFVGLLVQGNWGMQSYPQQLQVLRDLDQLFRVTSPPGNIFIRRPDPSSPPNFRIESFLTQSWQLEFVGEKCSVIVAVGDALLQMECAGSAQPYGPGGESPEGEAG